MDVLLVIFVVGSRLFIDVSEVNSNPRVYHLRRSCVRSCRYTWFRSFRYTLLGRDMRELWKEIVWLCCPMVKCRGTKGDLNCIGIIRLDEVSVRSIKCLMQDSSGFLKLVIVSIRDRFAEGLCSFGTCYMVLNSSEKFHTR